jgi:hypothetical protein
VSAWSASTTTWQIKLTTKADTQGWPFSIVVLCSLRVREVPGSIPGRALFLLHFFLPPLPFLELFHRCQQRSQWSAGPWRQCRVCGCVQDGTGGKQGEGVECAWLLSFKFPSVFAVPSSISACSYTCLSQEVLGLEGESIVSISAGENHSLVITKKA